MKVMKITVLFLKKKKTVRQTSRLYGSIIEV